MPLKKCLFAGCLCLILAGCATKPEDDPSYVSPMMYSNYDCSQIQAEMKRVSTRLDQVSKTEASGQALNAAVAVFAISQGYGFDDSQSQVEGKRLRNQTALLEQRSIEKKCKI